MTETRRRRTELSIDDVQFADADSGLMPAGVFPPLWEAIHRWKHRELRGMLWAVYGSGGADATTATVAGGGRRGRRISEHNDRLVTEAPNASNTSVGGEIAGRTILYDPMILAAALTTTMHREEDGFGSENDYDDDEVFAPQARAIRGTIEAMLEFGASVNARFCGVHSLLNIVTRYPSGNFPRVRPVGCRRGCRFVDTLRDVAMVMEHPDKEEPLPQTMAEAGIDFGELACVRCKLNYDRITLLCDYGADVEGLLSVPPTSTPTPAGGASAIIVPPPQNATPLHYAANAHNAAITYALLVHGANVNAVASLPVSIYTLHSQEGGGGNDNGVVTYEDELVTPLDLLDSDLIDEWDAQPVQALLKLCGGRRYADLLIAASERR